MEAAREPVMALVEITQTVDAKGLSCPMPIVKTAQAIKTIESGEVLEVLATDAGSVKDFAAWCKSTGNELVDQSSDGTVYRFVIRRK
jgi:tRNA 2-thiouridine synthesizing protein A